MDDTSADKAVRRVGFVTLPIGLGLLANPAPVAGLLGGTGDHHAALRIIAVCDLALVPGLIGGQRKVEWMAARVALNLGIAAYCLRFGRPGMGGARIGAGAMVVASVADISTIAALRRTRTVVARS